MIKTKLISHLYYSAHPQFLTDINLNSPHKGLGSDSISDLTEERGAVAVSPGTLPPGLTEEEAEELRLELTKVNTCPLHEADDLF